MKVSELIEKLKELPQDARVFHLWDGEPRTEINVIWLSKRGHVVTADFSQTAYSDIVRPLDVPSDLDFWETSANPETFDENSDWNKFYPWDENVTETTMVRFDCQGAFNEGVDDKQWRSYVESLGMKIIKAGYSSFGACFFIEVENYQADPKKIIVKLETDPKSFNWDSV